MKIHKRWVKRARQMSLTENGGGGRMLRHTRTLQRRRRDGQTFHPEEGAGTGGPVLAAPGPSGVRARRAGSVPHLPRAPLLPPCQGNALGCSSAFAWLAVHKYIQFGREALWALLGPEGHSPGSWMPGWRWAAVCNSPCQQNPCVSGKWRLWWAVK